jgi:hypothetical protein
MPKTQVGPVAATPHGRCVVFDELWLRGAGCALGDRVTRYQVGRTDRWLRPRDCPASRGFPSQTASPGRHQARGNRPKPGLTKGGQARTASGQAHMPPRASLLRRTRAPWAGARLQRSKPPAPQGNRESVGQGDAPSRVYVYQVDSDWYEVDWELTGISEKRFQLLALAAYELKRTLECQLVAARPRRRERFLRKGTLQVSEPVAYGQLKLAL